MRDHPERDLLYIKAQILCKGLKCNEDSPEISQLFDPTKTKRTGNVGIHFRIGGYNINGAMDGLYDNKSIYSNKSSFELKKYNIDNKISWILRDNGTELYEVDLIKPPAWYSKKTSSGTPMTKLFLCEGDSNLMGSISNYCNYFKDNLQCKFCGLEQTHLSLLRPSEYAEVIIEALINNPRSTITITFGSIGHDNEANILLYYLKIIFDIVKKELPNVKRIPLQVECTPPQKIDHIKRLIEVGVNSFSINLEIFDDDIRKDICPGKSKIPKSKYEEMWNYIVESLGSYRAGSALLVGLEPEESTLEGAKYLLDHKVLPNPLPFKPIPGSKYENKETTDPNLYFDICKKISKMIDECHIDRKMRLGCTTCGACSMELDF